MKLFRIGLGLLLPWAAAGQSPPLCSELQGKFDRVQAGWLAEATPRAEVERVFGVPSRVATSGLCTELVYAPAGCSAGFTVCSEGKVIRKTLTMGAAVDAGPIANDPAPLKEAIVSLQITMRELQAQIARLEQIVEGLKQAPAPAPASAASSLGAPSSRRTQPAVRPQCAATTAKGVRCSRRAEEGSGYCWQHKKGGGT